MKKKKLIKLLNQQADIIREVHLKYDSLVSQLKEDDILIVKKLLERHGNLTIDVNSHHNGIYTEYEYNFKLKI